MPPDPVSDVVIFNGTAEFGTDTLRYMKPALVDMTPPRPGFVGSSPEQMGADYSVAIRIRPDKVRGW
jgi:hypothetical protein